MSGIRRAKQDLTWTNIDLPENLKRVQSFSASKHSSKVLVNATKQHSLHVTSMTEFNNFLTMLADNTRCSRKLPNGCTCDGSYTQCSIVEKGVGGALKGTIVCNKCNFVLNYGGEDINTTTP